MNIRIQILPVVAAAALIPLLGGCYTQLETVESAYDEPVAEEDTVATEVVEEFDRDYPPPGYYATFSYYHPGFTVGYTAYDPWDWYYYPGPVWYGSWYPPYYYYPAYSCWPYYPSYYPYYPVVYYDNNNSGGYYPGGGGRPSDTRDFGNSRGYGDGLGTRGRGGIATRTGDDKDGGPVTAIPASISRPTRQGGATVASGSGGKKTETPQRRAAVNRTSTRRIASPEAAPADRGNSGATRGGSDRGSVSSPPKSSPPPPASSGSRGSSSSSGGSRGRGPRSR